jgi:hypothetical protein
VSRNFFHFHLITFLRNARKKKCSEDILRLKFLRSGCLVRRILCVSSVVVPLNNVMLILPTSVVLTWNSVFSSLRDGGDL